MTLPERSPWTSIVRAKTFSEEESWALANQWSQLFPKKAVLTLYGPLGAGKTCFVKGLAASRLGLPPHTVTSPTFTYLQIYGERSHSPLFHFDLYRLQGIHDFLALGLEEFLEEEALCCIEWADRIEPLLPPDYWQLTITSPSQNMKERHWALSHLAPSSRSTIT